MQYRNLTSQEIEKLKRQGCQSKDWHLILVDKKFVLKENLINVRFFGKIYLGVLEKNIQVYPQLDLTSGIYNALLHNAKINNNCYIENTNIINSDVGEECVLVNVRNVITENKPTFAIGNKIKVLVETGGREITIIPEMTPALAHLVCHYPQNKIVKKYLDELINKAENKKPERTCLENNVRVYNTNTIKNVWIQSHTIIENANYIEEASIISKNSIVTKLGNGVIVKNSLLVDATEVNDNCMLNNVFVGYKVKLEKGFTAENCLFFNHSEFSQGEAVAVLAGPLATSHHKATLAIANQCSFINYGSNSNASNHLYKQGPKHSGVLQRGVKLGSGSYLKYPAMIGAFTTVIGRHFKSIDTKKLPYSLVIESNQKSILIPAVNVFSVGLYRDYIKWQERAGIEKYLPQQEKINLEIYSPFTTQYVLNALDILKSHRQNIEKKDIEYKNCYIPYKCIENAINIYEKYLIFYCGYVLIKSIKRLKINNIKNICKEINQELKNIHSEKLEKWSDYTGIFIQDKQVQKIFCEIENTSNKNVWQDLIKEITDKYEHNEWVYVIKIIQLKFELTKDISENKVVEFFDLWKNVVKFRQEKIINDAKKEFTKEMKIACGLENSKKIDFQVVYGEIQENSLLKQLKNETDDYINIADRILSTAD